MTEDKDGGHGIGPGDDERTVDLDWDAKMGNARKTVMLDAEEDSRTVMLDGPDEERVPYQDEKPPVHGGLCLNCMKEFNPDESICPFCGFRRNTPPKEICHLHPGMMLRERYIVGTVVGFGGFGILYRAWDKKLSVMVAIKEYYPAGMVNRIPGEKEVVLYTGRREEEYRKGLMRFLDEARNTAKFNNLEQVVHVFDFFEENRTAYMVMEFLDGISFKDEIKEAGGKVSWLRGLEVAFVVIEALKSIHKAGIIHRDISPDNIFICRDGKVKVLDFGAARFSDGSKEENLTKVLKLGFAPPEQYRTKSRQGPWTDVYALGATLYRAVTGVMPMDSSDREREDLLEPPGKLVKELPDYLNKAILKAMALKSEYRFQNVEELRKGLANEKPVRELEKEIRLRRRLRTVSLCLVTAILMAAGTAGWRIYQNRRMEATLEGVSLSVWVMADGGDGKEQETFLAAIQEFQGAYPNLQLSVEYVEEDYEKKLAEALSNGAGPDLFESGGMGEEIEPYLEPADSLFSLIERKDYFFLEQYEDYYPERKKVPLGFDMEMYYKNTLVPEPDDGKEPDCALEDFLDGKEPRYRGTVKDYFPIQNALSGYYEVEEGQSDNARGFLCREWSINGSSRALSQTAAIRLLYYLLGENGQSALFISNHDVIPLNRAVADTWWEIYGELGFAKDRVSGLDMAR